MKGNELPARRGRATRDNPQGRFNDLRIEEDPSALSEEELRAIPTRYHADMTRQILAENQSPDVGFTYSINPYRGCEHGCIYCYARPSHEYLGWSAGLDFETQIMVKHEAAALLAEALSAPSWKPSPIALSGNTDPYQPIERELGITRACLGVLARHRNPVAVITKNHLVVRDGDYLEELAAYGAARVYISLTTLRDDLVQVMEPRTSRPARRLQAMEALAARGIPVGVMVAPVIPGLTDEELPRLLQAAADHGATQAGYVLLRLPGTVEPLFIDWVQRALPDRADRILRRIRELRGGTLSDPRFHTRMRGEGLWAETLRSLFDIGCAKAGLLRERVPLSVAHFRRLRHGQHSLFDGSI